MTDQRTLVQARVSIDDAKQLDVDVQTLGLTSRSEAVRAGLRLLHRQAQDAALVAAHEAYYGVGAQAPVSDLAAFGDHIAADTVAEREAR